MWRCGSFEFTCSVPIVMGVLNCTPDSFSDGGRFVDFDAAYAAACLMKQQGAQIIDIGGESSRPGAQSVDPFEEWNRIAKVVETLAREGFCVSVDTRHSAVARQALEAGASIFNDVTGFTDEAMIALAASNSCGLVVVHNAGFPARPDNDHSFTYNDVVFDVRDWLAQQATLLQDRGVEASRICLDPGPGFGKTHSQTIELMRNLHEVARLGYPTMVAASRKAYVAHAYHLDKVGSMPPGEDLSEDERQVKLDEASAVEALLGCELGATIVRTHNVEAAARALKDLRPYVLIGLGSNQALMGSAPGEDETAALRESKIAQINLAISQMCSLPDTQIIDIAHFYESEPAYDLEQDSFVNTVLLARTGLPPRELLGYLQAIENSLGRVRTRPNGPRTIDLDILDYQFYQSDMPELLLPHPRINERDFVVKPLLELRPQHELADGTKVCIVPEEQRLGHATLLGS